MKKISILLSLIIFIMCSSFVSAGFWDWLTGNVVSEPLSLDMECSVYG
ncbi:hypothetical protein HQ529_04475, partial [Candidatus Woesearchaeota archaeon]|nr:hypothetical protein [Candidatus Woesearchaeota archaeon]